MRLGDVDREQLFERLKAAAAAGAISFAELERRVERVARAGTREEAWAEVADLPGAPGSGDAGHATPPARARGRRGHAESDQPGSDWRPTPERFRDPRSGLIMRVWEDAAGQRHYVRDG